MIIKCFTEPPIDNNNYLIIDEISKEAVLIDCSALDEKINDALKEYDVVLKKILLTHGHFDHITGIRNNPDVKVYMHEGDMEWVSNINKYLPMFGMSDVTIPQIDVFVQDNDVIRIGNIEIKVIHTPGHTEGGVCYLIENKLFSGDTLFKESVGRCDLPGGNFDKIVKSIQTKLFTLPEEIEVYPGHGKNTTIGWEKAHNCML